MRFRITQTIDLIHSYSEIANLVVKGDPFKKKPRNSTFSTNTTVKANSIKPNLLEGQQSFEGSEVKSSLFGSQITEQARISRASEIPVTVEEVNSDESNYSSEGSKESQEDQDGSEGETHHIGESLGNLTDLESIVQQLEDESKKQQANQKTQKNSQ